MKKVKDIQTVSKSNMDDFNIAVLLLVKEGYIPLDVLQITATPPVYGSDGRFNCGPWTYYTQQFVKYED